MQDKDWGLIFFPMCISSGSNTICCKDFPFPIDNLAPLSKNQLIVNV